MEKDYAEILLEEMRDKFGLVLESHDLLNRRIDNLTAEVAETNRRLDERTKALSDHITTEVCRLDQKIDKLDQKLDQVATDLAEHRADTERHRGYMVAEQ
jgi:hypothetical protein